MKKRPVNDWERKLVLLAAVAMVAAFAAFGDKGLLDVYRLTCERDGILGQNKALAEENALLEQQIARLDSDKRYIGHIARAELGMIGKDEAIYRLEEKAPPAK